MHIHVHIDSGSADPKLDQILRAIHDFEVRMARTLAEMITEIQTRLDANLAAVEENTTIGQGLVTLVEGIKAQNLALKQQVLDAIKAGGDPATLQPIIDRIEANNTVLTASTAKSAAALVANTDAA